TITGDDTPAERCFYKSTAPLVAFAECFSSFFQSLRVNNDAQMRGLPQISARNNRHPVRGNNTLCISKAYFVIENGPFPSCQGNYILNGRLVGIVIEGVATNKSLGRSACVSCSHTAYPQNLAPVITGGNHNCRRYSLNDLLQPLLLGTLLCFTLIAFAYIYQAAPDRTLLCRR